MIKKYDDKSEEIIKGWNDATENYKQELISENESTIVIPLKTKIFRNDYKKASFERNSKELHALVFDEGFDIYYKNP